MKRCVIIGGGIIGLCSAYYLHKQGHEVLVIDKSNLDVGASYVNAGYLSPSHIIPLSSPGIVKKGVKWMFNPSSPLYIKPRFNVHFLKWAIAFNKSCNSQHVKKSAPIIRDITVLSQQLFAEIITAEKFNTHYEKKGLLMLCQTEKGLKEEFEMAKMAKALGLEAKVVSRNELAALQPNVEINAIGGTFYKCDHHSTPGEFMLALKKYLKSAGVQIRSNENVEDIKLKNKQIASIFTDKEDYTADEFILAAGAWSPTLCKKVGLNLLLEAGKGYRIDTSRKTDITLPAILAEAKVAITPMHNFTRFAGTMEIAGINNTINPIRVEAIANAVKRYYPSITLSQEEKSNAASGLRPVSPDGLPYIGKSSKCRNLTIAAGHAMMGWSMAAATGLLVNEIVSGSPTSLNIAAFHPDRRF